MSVRLVVVIMKGTMIEVIADAMMPIAMVGMKMHGIITPIMMISQIGIMIMTPGMIKQYLA
jgi:hypothetical protein